MSGLLVLALVVIVLGAVGHGFRDVASMLGSLLRSFAPGQRRSAGARPNILIPALILIVLGAFGALGTVISRSGGAAVFSAIMLGIGMPMLVISVYRGLGITQPPLYAWVLAAGIIISPFGLLAWYAAVIAAEIIAAGLLLLWFDRKDKILDTYAADNTDPAQKQLGRLRRTAIVMAVLACTVALTAASAAYVWLWLIVIGVLAAVYIVRKLRSMRRAKAEEERARQEEVDRILNTKVAGLDDEDDELLRKYLQKTNVPLRKGQRLAVRAGRLELRLTGGSDGDVDCYVFLLDARSKVQGDEDLVFFGQSRSPDGSVQVVDGASGPGADIELARVPQQLESIVVAFALGIDAPPQATWTGGTLLVESGAETYTYPLAADGKTRSVSALELYRRDGSWKLWLTDHRSIRGISALCDEYGVDVA